MATPAQGFNAELICRKAKNAGRAIMLAPASALAQPMRNAMKQVLSLATVAILTMGLSAWAAETNTTSSAAAGQTATHSADSMTSGHHMMPASKQDQMANKSMSSMNPKCSDEALAKMPADHRAACHKKN